MQIQLSSGDRQIFSLPSVRLDADLRILHTNEAAAAFGVQAGEILPCCDPAGDFLLWHEAFFSGMADPETHPLRETEHGFRIRLKGFHGFRLAYITYTRSLGESRAVAALFRSQREFLCFAPFLSERYSHFTDRLNGHFRVLRSRCSAILADPHVSRQAAAEAVEELLSAAMFTLRVFTPVGRGSSELRMYRLSFLMDRYLTEILLSLHAPDCRIECGGEEDISLPADAAAMFLLWTSLLRILNDMSPDRRIRITQHVCGEDAEIRFSAAVRHMPLTAARVSDLTALTAALPEAELLLILSEYLAGVQDCFLDVIPDPEENRITFSLYIPGEKQIPDFKSPQEAEDIIKEAGRCLKGFLRISAQSSEEAE